MALYRALRTLDVETREVFYLRLRGDMTFEEIGDIIGRSAVWCAGGLLSRQGKAEGEDAA